LRKQNPVIVYGKYDLIPDTHEDIYAFTRTLDDDRLLVVLNFSKGTPSFTLSENVPFSEEELMISNYEVIPAEGIRAMTLRPYEARVYRLR